MQSLRTPTLRRTVAARIAFPVLLFCLAFGDSTLAATFRGLGDLPGGSFLSVATAVSSNGYVVVGYSSSAQGSQAFRWTATNGLVALGDLPGGTFSSFATAVSADGSVVVGEGKSASGTEAFRWAQTLGMTALGDLPGNAFYSSASAVSADGHTVVGNSSSTQSGNRNEAFRWTQRTGMVGLGDLPGGGFASRAWGVSADGAVVIGESSSSNSTPNFEGFRWTAATGMIGIGDLPGGLFHSIAYAISGDGSAVTGYSLPPSGVHEAFRWTAETGIVPMGFIPCSDWTIGWAISGNGSVIVGDAATTQGDCVFIWNSMNGMRRLREVLESDHRLDLSGWVLREAKGISYDGLVIVGQGLNPSGATEAWLADLRPPSLEILRVGPAVILSWPTNFADFQLETSPTIEASAWQTLPAHRNGEKFIATNNATIIRQFFRLRKQ